MRKLKNAKYFFLVALILFLTGCPPVTVKIITPSDGDYFESGELIIFTGLARDFIDGNLSGNSLVWSSDIDGEIGTDLTVSRNDLSNGEHTITLTATNSQNESKSAAITITIGESTTTTTVSDISGSLEIQKILGPLLVPMEAAVIIPFRLEGTEIVTEGGPWMTPISGDNVPYLEGCTIDYSGEYTVRNVEGELVTIDPSNPFLRFRYEEYETEFWTITCAEGSFGDEWIPGWRESECGLDLVDGATWGGGPNVRFRCVLHLD